MIRLPLRRPPARSRWATVLLLAALAVVGPSCGDDGFTGAGPASGGVVAVRIAQRDLTMIMGDTLPLSAVGFDKELSAVAGKNVTWSSSAPAVAEVDAKGVLRAKSAGRAVIGAEIDGVKDSATVNVVEPPVARIAIAPAAATVILGQAKALVATAYSAKDSILAGRAFTWTSSESTVASVDAAGTVTATGVGAATVTVTAEGVSASAAITVVPVPVKSVVVAPDPAAVPLGRTVQLAATPRDSVNGALAGRTVTWASADTLVATVSATGLVAGVALGSTTVTATVEGVSRAVPVTVSAPAIGVSAASVSFAARDAGPNPAAQVLNVTNTGTFTLDGLSSAVAYGPEGSGWLAVSLSATTAPATLSLQATSGGLAPGTYTASVTVASTAPGAQAKTVVVTLTVAPFPVLALSGATAAFTAQAGASDPASATLGVTNAGTGTLSGLSAAVAYGAGQPTGWLSATLDQTTAPATLTLHASATLLPGSYTATVTVASSLAEVASQTVAVTYAVSQPAVIAASTTALTFASPSGGAPAPAQVVDVTNGGTGILTGLTATVAYAAGQPTGWLTAALGATSAPAALTVSAVAGTLPLGTYDATITVASTLPSVAARTIGVTFTVADGAVIGLAATTAGATAQVDGADPAAASLAVSSLGTVPATGLSVATTYGAGASGWLAASLGAAAAPTTLTLQPHVAGLAVGTYTATTTVSSSLPNVTPRSVTYTLTVAQTASIGLSAATRTFVAPSGGTSPAAQTIAVTNAGTGALAGLAAGVAYGASEPTGWLAAALDAATAPATLTLTPSTSALPSGTYHATVTVSSSLAGVAAKTVAVTLTVTAGAAIGVSTNAVSAAAQVNGANPAAATVAVSSAGVVPLTGLSITKLRASAWLDASLSGTAAPATLTLQPRTTGLAIGTYRDTVVITSSLPSVRPESVAVLFTVSQTASIGLSVTTRAFAALSGAAASPAAQTVNVSNAGTGALSGLAASVTYTGGGSPGWLAAALDQTTAPATLTLTPTLGTLAPGTYTANVVVSSTLTSVASQTVAVTFTVAQGAQIGVSTTGVSLLRQQTDVSDDQVTVSITNAGTPGSALSGLSVSKSAGAAWLTLGGLSATSAPSGTPATFAIKANVGSPALATGTYNATVTVSSSLAGVPSRDIAVTFTVANGAAIGLSASTVSSSAQPGAAPAFAPVGITNGGTGAAGDVVGLPASPTITYTSGTAGWLQASINASATPATLSLAPTAAASTLGLGTYTADVAITSTTPNVAARTVTITLTVAQTATIALSATSRSFSAASGVGNPAPQTVGVSNGGTGTLDGLSVKSVTYGPTATGWLGAALNVATAPATLTLTPTTGSLPLGTHTATVTVGSSRAGVADQQVSVSFTVTSGPSIAVASSSVGFAAQVQGANPGSQGVAVTNGSGIGTLSGLSVQSVTYGAGATGWLTTASLGSATAPTTLTLQPTTGSLAIGSYSATVRLASSLPNVATKDVTASFTIAQTASVALSANSRSYSALRSDASVPAQTVTVSNGGTGVLDQLTTSTTYDAGATGWLAASLNTTTAPATLTLTPSVGSLAAGTYTAHVQVGSSRPSVPTQTVDVTFTVSAGAAIGVAGTASLSAQVQQTAAAQDLAVTNTGSGTLSGLSAAVGSYGVTSGTAGATGWLAATFPSGTTAPATLRLTPNTAGLAAGTYTAVVTVSSSLPNVTAKTVNVTFTVSQTASIALTSTTATFANAQLGGSPTPSNQTITVSNGGSGVLDGLSIKSITYDVASGATTWLSTSSLSASTAPATLTLAANQGALAIGTYTATVTIGSTRPGIADKAVAVTLTVAQNAVLSLTPGTWTPSLQEASGTTANQAVSITNSGTAGTVAGLSFGVAYGGGEPTGWLSGTFSGGVTTAPTTLNLTSSVGALAPATYHATVTVSSTTTGVASKTVTVTFTVTAKPVISTAGVTSRSYTVTRGSNPSSQTVSITNTGGGTLSGLTATLLSGGTGWLDGAGALSLNTTTAPATLTIQPTTSSLASSPTNAVVRIASSVAGVSPVDVTVSVTVQQPILTLDGSAASTSRALGAQVRGVAITSSTVTVGNGGAGTMPVSVTDDATWLTPSFSSTSLGGGGSTTLTLDYNSAGLTAGDYTGTVTISSSVPGVTTRTVTVTLTVRQPLITVGSVSNPPVVRAGVSATPTGSSVAITNCTATSCGASTALAGLARGTITYSFGAPSFIASATLNSSTSPATLSITYNTFTASHGTWTATIPITSTTTGTTTANVVVTLTANWIFADVTPLFGSSSQCEGCHSQSFGTYNNLFSPNTANTSSACGSLGQPRVVAGNGAGSILYRKVAVQAGVAGVTLPCGSSMPAPGTTLTPAQVQKIKEWIDDGAKNLTP